MCYVYAVCRFFVVPGECQYLIYVLLFISSLYLSFLLFILCKCVYVCMYILFSLSYVVSLFFEYQYLIAATLNRRQPAELTFSSTLKYTNNGTNNLSSSNVSRDNVSRGIGRITET